MYTVFCSNTTAMSEKINKQAKAMLSSDDEFRMRKGVGWVGVRVREVTGTPPRSGQHRCIGEGSKGIILEAPSPLLLRLAGLDTRGWCHTYSCNLSPCIISAPQVLQENLLT